MSAGPSSGPRTVGLTLGKFAPLHRGHQLVIDTALAEVDHLIVLVYDSPEVTAIPLQTRVAWFTDLYPTVEVIEAWGGPTETGNTPGIEAAHEAYILTLLASRCVTHFYSSEFYGAHVSRALGAVDRRVDEARARVPISGTQVREDPHASRAHVHPRVYRDLVERVVLLGAPSTGKSTLAEALAESFDTAFMPEYGRTYWEENQVDRRLTSAQLVEIAEGHRQREDAAAEQANRYLFVDTDASTTRIFCRHYTGAVPAQLDAYVEACKARYAHVFLCGDDIPYDDTWDRSGEGNRADFQRQIVEDLEARGVEYVLLCGSVQERVDAVRAALAERLRLR